MSSTDAGQVAELDGFLEQLRSYPGPAQLAVDIARLLLSEPTETLLTALVKREFEQQDD